MPRVRIAVASHTGLDGSRSAIRTACSALLDDVIDRTISPTGGHWQLKRAATGAPRLYVNGIRSNLAVSIAHCGEWIAVGLSQGVAFGLDIERIRPRPRMHAIGDFLGWPREEMDSAGFLARWTLWEAFAKCMERSVLQRENQSIDELAAHRTPGRLVNNRREAALCDRVDDVLILSVVISGRLPDGLAQRELDLHAMRHWSPGH